eukprot:s1037_g3.t1
MAHLALESDQQQQRPEQAPKTMWQVDQEGFEVQLNLWSRPTPHSISAHGVGMNGFGSNRPALPSSVSTPVTTNPVVPSVTTSVGAFKDRCPYWPQFQHSTVRWK